VPLTIILLIVAVGLASVAAAVLIGSASGYFFVALIALLVPAAGLGSLVHRANVESGRSFLLGGIGWSCMVIVASPIWLSRTEAFFQVGFSTTQAEEMDRWLPGLPVPDPIEDGDTLAACDCDRPPLGRGEVTAATDASPSAPPIMDEALGDLVVLPYEGTASAMSLPLTLEMDGESLDTELLFDTGASMTAIHPRLLAALGYTVPDDAPTIRTQTANGLRESPLVFLDRIWLGGFVVEGVTATVCGGCGRLNGLLGLNVSSSFRVEVDQARRELLFRPEMRPDRHLDIRHWLDFGLIRRGPELSLVMENIAPRDIRAANVRLWCEEQDVERFVRFSEVDSEERVEAVVSPTLPCDRPIVTLIEGRW